MSIDTETVMTSELDIYIDKVFQKAFIDLYTHSNRYIELTGDCINNNIECKCNICE